MLRKVTKLCQLILRKCRVHRKQRSLRAEAEAITRKIKASFEDMFMEKDQTFSVNNDKSLDDEEDEERPKVSLASLIKLDLLPVSTGGFRLNIGKDEDKMAKIE